jgi:YaiO family outer membrane protein
VLILLLTTLLSVQAPDPKAEAERLARSGAYEEALEQFRALAAINPADLEARTWIARIHVIMGHLRQGEDVYRTILVDSPDRLDTLVGLGSVLVSQGRLEEARAFLTRAETLAPDDLEVLAAQGSLNLADAQNRLAVGYYGRASVIAPEQHDLRLNFEEARRRYDHRFEAAYLNETFSDTTPDTQSGDFTLNLRVNQQLRVFGRGQQERRFSRTDARAGGGLEWHAHQPALSSVRAFALVGPDNDVLPQVDAGLGLGWIHRTATFMTATFTMNGRYFRFEDARMWTIGPAVRLDVRDDVMVSGSYMHTSTEFAGFDRLVGGNSADIRGAFRIQPRLWLEGGYAHGIENFDRVTIDRLGRFRADTVSGTARFDLHSLTSIGATYEYQRVEGGAKMGRVTARLIQSF